MRSELHYTLIIYRRIFQYLPIIVNFGRIPTCFSFSFWVTLYHCIIVIWCRYPPGKATCFLDSFSVVISWGQDSSEQKSICHNVHLIFDCMRLLPTIKLSFFIYYCLTNDYNLICLRINYDVACPMDFRKYPYDTQTCKVKYESCKFWQKIIVCFPH